MKIENNTFKNNSAFSGTFLKIFINDNWDIDSSNIIKA